MESEEVFEQEKLSCFNARRLALKEKKFSSISWYIYMNYSNPDKAVKRSLKVVHGSIIVSFMCTTNPLPFFYLHYEVFTNLLSL